MFAERYSEVQYEKARGCGRVYDDSRLKGVFIEGLHDSIRFSMRAYLLAHKMQLCEAWRGMRHRCQSDEKNVTVAALAATSMVTPEDDNNNL